MGLFSSLLPIAGSIIGNTIAPGIGGAIGGALGSAVGGSGVKQSGTSTGTTSGTTSSTSQQQLDPRIQEIFFGANGQQGLLDRYRSLLGQPQSQGSQFIGDLASNYLNGGAGDDVNAIRNAGYGLLKGNQAPTIGAAVANAAQIAAPSQNDINLSPAYQNFIYGNAAENPYLKASLQSGIDQSNQAFRTNLGNVTDTLQRQILPGIRGNAISAGQFGSSRQGIAEGLALSDYSKQATNAAQQLGLANIAATTGAQSNAFSQGQDRALSALQGLSGQQYGVAQQNAALRQQAELQNAQLRQAADNTNVNAGLQTQAQNNAASIAGSGLLSGNLAQLYGYNQNANNAGINRALQVNSLLQPYTNLGSTYTSSGTNTGTNSQPIYTNPTANALGAAGSALGLYNQFAKLGGSNTTSGVTTGAGSYGGGPAGSFYDGYGWQQY